MKIYTKTGDKGYTSLIGGSRVLKSHLRMECCGTVDELNAYIGMICDQENVPEQKKTLQVIQDRLFTMGALLAADPEKSRMNLPDLYQSDVECLEKQIDQMNEYLPELRQFILPGGADSISACHIARCVCRRAERIVVSLAQENAVDEKIISYLNRLSDYLFVLARKRCQDRKLPENQWIPRYKSV